MIARPTQFTCYSCDEREIELTDKSSVEREGAAPPEDKYGGLSGKGMNPRPRVAFPSPSMKLLNAMNVFKLKSIV